MVEGAEAFAFSGSECERDLDGVVVAVALDAGMLVVRECMPLIVVTLFILRCGIGRTWKIHVHGSVCSDSSWRNGDQARY